MPYAVELNLSGRSGERVFKLWRALAKESVNSEMILLGAKPHISLVTAENLDPAGLKEILRQFAAARRPFAVSLDYVGWFPTAEGAMFLAPADIRELSDIHGRLCEILGQEGVVVGRYSQPGFWTPHCTVAMNLDPGKVGAAAEICLRSEAFGLVELDALSLIEYRPVREIDSFSLGG